MYTSSSNGAPWQISDHRVDEHGTLRQLSQPGPMLRRELVCGPRDCVAGQVVEAVGVLEPGAHLVMIAADEGCGRKRQDAIDDRIRIGAVADEISEHERVIVAARGSQHRVERLQIGVDVADDEISHLFRGPNTRLRGSAASARREGSPPHRRTRGPQRSWLLRCEQATETHSLWAVLSIADPF